MVNVAEEKLSLQGLEKVVKEKLFARVESGSSIDIGNVSASSQPFQMQLETSNTLYEEKEHRFLFWEEVGCCCEATTIHEYCEAKSLLSSKPVTPPLLVTPLPVLVGNN